MTAPPVSYPVRMTENESQQWLTRAQAAQRLGVTPQTIDNYVRRGELERFKLAGQRLTRFRVQDVDALFKRASES